MPMPQFGYCLLSLVNRRRVELLLYALKVRCFYQLSYRFVVAEPARFELALSAVTGQRFSLLSYGSGWQSSIDSNYD